MKPLNLTINGLFINAAKLTLLAAVGWSVAPPISLPVEHSMIKKVIKYM